MIPDCRYEIVTVCLLSGTLFRPCVYFTTVFRIVGEKKVRFLALRAEPAHSFLGNLAHAVGAGLGIALSCDLRIASDRDKFGAAYAKVGLGGDYGTTWQLTQLLGEAKAKELMILGDIVDAEEALRIGLVNRVVPHDLLHDVVKEMATRIANGPLVSYRHMKENINLAVRSDFRTILDREALTHTLCGLTADHHEGIVAFLEKREAQFSGK